MNKRYQVFVSSTFRDLQEERAQVIQALLELNCIPSGMELFPAADEDQWSFIQRIIDDCDYYIMVMAGKYGSISPVTGKSYTQMEYEYAIEKRKPVIAFLFENPASLTMERCESDPDRRRRLEEFRALAQTKLCKHWSNPDQLGGLVSRSMVQLINRSPAVGWVRANLIGDESASQEIARLRRRIEELEGQLEGSGVVNIAALGLSHEDLAQGEQGVEWRYEYFEGIDREAKRKTIGIWIQWNEIFTTLAPHIQKGMFETEVRDIVNELIFLKKPSWENRSDINYVSLVDRDFETIKAQMRALGLIEIQESTNSEKATKWQLTKKGDLHVLGAKVVKRKKSAD